MNPIEAFRDVFSSLWTAILHPRVWAFSWLVVTAVSVVVVWPAWRVLDAELSHHPGASFTLDQALDVDLGRVHPELTLSLGGALALALLAGAVLAGGVLATVGLPARKVRFSQMLGEGGFLLARNLRVLGVGLVAALLLGWGFDALDGWLRHGPHAVAEPGAVALRLGFADLRWIHVFEALAWIRGLVFVGLLFVTKVAMARLADGSRCSALLAFGVALGRVLRRPLRAAGIVLLWTVIWVGGTFALGELTVWQLEVRHDLWGGLAAGQAGILVGQLVLVGLLLSARRFLLSTEVPRPEAPAADVTVVEVA